MAEITCKALYPYSGLGGEKIQTLEFKAGELIKVVFSGDAGWWEGEKNGERGWFPASYVTKVQELLPQKEDPEEKEEHEAWEEVCTDDGETYYVNAVTNETSWDIPKSLEAKQSITEVDDEAASQVSSSTSSEKSSETIPLSTPDGKKNISQSASPAVRRKEISSVKSDIDIVKSNPSPILQRSHTFSAPSNRLSCDSQQSHDLPESHVKLVNGLSFPKDNEAQRQELLQPGRSSYCDFFWSDTSENPSNHQSGFHVLYQKLLKGKQMCKEMADLFRAREAIELQYSKNLASLSSTIHASQEEGTLGEAWRQLKSATLLESRIHQDFANKLKIEISQSLLAQKEKEKKEMKKLEASIAELRKQVNLKYQAAEKTKQQLIEKTKDYELKLHSSKHTKDEVQKARRKSAKYAEELSNAVDQYNKRRQVWFEEMVTSTLVLESHEADRINAIKSTISKYSSLLQGAGNGCAETCNIIDEHLKLISPDKDREMWVSKNATGKIRPVELMI